MSNKTIIQRINSLLDSYDPKNVERREFEDAIGFHLQALENVDLDTMHRSRELVERVVSVHFWDAGEEFGSKDDEKTAIQALRQFIDNLPTD